ncbi:MAG TPA: hypothetical protein GX740_04900 [Acholeplasmataceae bacterium]|nr:hypothetical protein [Acholeplasmataceae bacterium]
MILNIFASALIIFGVVILFMVAVILNGLTKRPDNVELPEKCSSCTSSCVIRFDDKPRTKESIVEYYRNCEANNADQKA